MLSEAIHHSHIPYVRMPESLSAHFSYKWETTSSSISQLNLWTNSNFAHKTQRLKLLCDSSCLAVPSTNNIRIQHTLLFSRELSCIAAFASAVCSEKKHALHLVPIS